jgi:regulatory protein
MKITKIAQQVKRADRYSIFLDGKYSFSLSQVEVIDLGIRVGQELDKNDLDKYGAEAELSRAKNSCFRLLGYRSRSIGEIRDYLNGKKFDDEIINKTIEFLTSKDFLNDEAFARSWVENRVNIKKTSVRQLKLELRQKKVPVEIINKVLEDEDVDEVELIKEIIDKKRTQLKYHDDLKLKQYLARKGFSYSDISAALRGGTE